MHESDSSRHYGRHAEANANSVSECTDVHENAAHFCIELAELLRRPFVNFLPKVRDRELRGFINPCGLWSWVVTGAGAGWQFTTLEKPAPVARV